MVMQIRVMQSADTFDVLRVCPQFGMRPGSGHVMRVDASGARNVWKSVDRLALALVSVPGALLGPVVSLLLGAALVGHP